MSLLAGYDVVIELSNECVRHLIIANLAPSKTTNPPPFEVTLPLGTTEDRSGGLCYLKIGAIEADLQTARPMLIRLLFEGSSFETTKATVRLLDGSIEAPIYFPDVVTRNDSAHLALDLSGIEPWRVAFTPASKIRAKEQLRGTTLSYSAFERMSQESIARFIQKQPLLLIPLSVGITSAEGTLSPLKFYRLEARGFGPEEKAQQAFGLFGTLLVSHSYEGTESFKTVSAIPPEHHAAFSISADIFQRFVFCEAVADVLHCPVRALPTTCGDGSPDSEPSQTIYRLKTIKSELGEESIVLKGSFETESGEAEFEGEVALRIDNGAVTSFVKALDVSNSHGNGARDEFSQQADLGDYEALIGALITRVGQRMVEELNHCLASGLLGEAPDQVSIIKNTGLSFACKHKPDALLQSMALIRWG